MNKRKDMPAKLEETRRTGITMNVEQARACLKYMPSLKDELLKYFSANELGIEYFPKNVDDIRILGYNVNNKGKIMKSIPGCCDSDLTYPFYVDAKKAIAEARLRQIAFICNKERTTDWFLQNESKYVASYDLNNESIIVSEIKYTLDGAIYFKKKNDLRQSLSYHLDLWLDYFQVKK